MEDALHGQINARFQISLCKCRVESLLTGLDNVFKFQDNATRGQLGLDQAHRKGCRHVVWHFESVKAELIRLHAQKDFLQAQFNFAGFSNRRWLKCRSRGW
jgi:hypothetical protein